MDGLWWFLWVCSTVKSHRYTILTVSYWQRREIRSILTLKHDQKYSHSGRELGVLEFDLRKSDDVSRARTAGQMASRCASWRKTRIVARRSSLGDWRIRQCRTQTMVSISESNAKDRLAGHLRESVSPSPGVIFIWGASTAQGLKTAARR